MGISYGNNDIKGIMYGNSIINSVYLGTENIYKRMKDPIITAFYARYTNGFVDEYRSFYLDTDLNIIREDFNRQNTRPQNYAQYTRFIDTDDEGYSYYIDRKESGVYNVYKMHSETGQLTKLDATFPSLFYAPRYSSDLGKFINTDSGTTYYDKNFNQVGYEKGHKYHESYAYSPKYDVYITYEHSSSYKTKTIYKRDVNHNILSSVVVTNTADDASMRVFSIDEERFGVVWSYKRDINVYKYSDLSLIKTKQLAPYENQSYYNEKFYYNPNTKLYYRIWCYGHSYNDKYANIVCYDEDFNQVANTNYSTNSQYQSFEFSCFGFDDKGYVYAILEKGGQIDSDSARYFWLYAHKLDKRLNKLKSVTLVDRIDNYYPGASGDYVNCGVHNHKATMMYNPLVCNTKLMW